MEAQLDYLKVETEANEKFTEVWVNVPKGTKAGDVRWALGGNQLQVVAQRIKKDDEDRVIEDWLLKKVVYVDREVGAYVEMVEEEYGLYFKIDRNV